MSKSAAITRVLQGIVTRGVVESSRASTSMQTLQVSTLDGLLDECEHFEPFGFTSRPNDGAEALVLQVGGTGHPVVVSAPDRRERAKSLAKGEVCLYDANGNKLILGSSGASLNCNLDCGGSVNADDGYTVGAATGVSGTLTLLGPTTSLPLAVITFKGGIATNVTPTGPSTWVAT